MNARTLIAGLVSMVAGSAAMAQDFTSMDLNAMNNAFNARMNAQINTQTQDIIRRVLADPRAQAMYQQHRAAGGRLTPEQFAYNYAATGGFTPQGMANYRASEARNQAAEMNSYNGYRAAQAARAAAQNVWAAGYHRNNAEFGNQLRGNSTYSNPVTGGTTVLPHTLQPGQYVQDSGGRYYTVDARGNYYVFNNGTWHTMGR